MRQIDDPVLVREQYADEANLDAPEILGSSFARVEAREANGTVSIPGDDMIWRYLRSMSLPVAASRPPHDLPFRVHRVTTVFVATK